MISLLACLYLAFQCCFSLSVATVAQNSSQPSVQWTPSPTAMPKIPLLAVSPEETENILSVTIRFHSVVAGVKVYYTHDGSDPSPTSLSTTTGTPILINKLGTVVVKGYATKEGMLDSDVTTKEYHILDMCAPPTFLPNGGTYEGSATVVMSSATYLSKVCYNIDSLSEPSAKDSACIESGKSMILNTPGTHAIKAITVKENMADSTVSEAEFSILAQVATPVITPELDVFPVSALLTFTCSTPGATIYYTLDSSDPTTASLTVDSGQSIVVDTIGRHTVRAFATEPSMLASAVAVKVFSIQQRMLEPALLPPPGSYTGDLELTFHCVQSTDDDTASAQLPVNGRVYYTLDGSTTPSELHSKSVPCDGTVVIPAPGSVTVRAMATAADKSASSVIQGVYALKRPAYDQHPVNPAASAFRVQPDVQVIVVNKDLADSYYCPKRNMRGRLVVLCNPVGHFDIVPPLGGCGAGVLQLPSRSGRNFQPAEGINLTNFIAKTGTGASSPVSIANANSNGLTAKTNLRTAASTTQDSIKSSSTMNTPSSTSTDTSGSELPANLSFALNAEKISKLPQSLRKLFESEGGSGVRVELLEDLQSQYDAVSGLGCQVVSNAGFFNTTSSACIGDIVSSGTVHQLSDLHNVNFGIRNGSFVVGYVEKEEILDPEQQPFDFLISGLGWLVRNGVSYVRESFSSVGDAESMAPQSTGIQFLTVHSARTALGHDIHGNLMILQVEGETWVRGMTLYEFADFAVELGFHSAINLDGGGSATMTQNHTLVSEPSWRCPDAPYNSSSFFRCEKKVSSITCVHAMAPPFIDTSVLERYAHPHSQAPTKQPTARPTAAPTGTPTITRTATPTTATTEPASTNDDIGSSSSVNSTVAMDIKLATLRSSLAFYELSAGVLMITLFISIALHISSFCFYSNCKRKGDARSSSYSSTNDNDGGRNNEGRNAPEVQMVDVNDGSRHFREIPEVSAPSSSYAQIPADTHAPPQYASPSRAERSVMVSHPPGALLPSPASITKAPAATTAPSQLLLQHPPARKASPLPSGEEELRDLADWRPPSAARNAGGVTGSSGGARSAEDDFYLDSEEDEACDDRSRLLQKQSSGKNQQHKQAALEQRHSKGVSAREASESESSDNGMGSLPRRGLMSKTSKPKASSLSKGKLKQNKAGKL